MGHYLCNKPHVELKVEGDFSLFSTLSFFLCLLSLCLSLAPSLSVSVRCCVFCVVCVVVWLLCGCCVVVVWLLCVWCGTLKNRRVYIRNAPCVPSTRPHVLYMWACCRYTRRRFECTHGGRFECTHAGGVCGRGGGEGSCQRKHTWSKHLPQRFTK